MSTTIPVLKGKFGSTDYYITTMKANELSDKLKIPKDLIEWEDMTIEERFQRDVNYARVKKHIAPYLATDPDRFFGALIVDMYNSEGIQFEPLDQLLTQVPISYRGSASAFGFLHLTGGEVLVPLDGQHRLAAIRFAITGKDEKGQDIKGMDANLEVAQDEVTLILVAHDNKKARKIFNKVNRYAKSTSKAENLITADDDIVAVVTREIANDEIGERLINYQSNTLSKKSGQFTTLSTLYDANHKILELSFNKKIDTTVLPDPAIQKLYRTELKNVWEQLLGGIELFRLALADKSEAGDQKRSEIRDQFLLGKPIAQFALVIAFMRLRNTTASDGSKFPDEEILRRLNEIDWSVSSMLWQRVMLNGSRVVAGRQAAMFASRFIAYLAGEYLAEPEVNALRENYRALFSPEERSKVDLPEV